MEVKQNGKPFGKRIGLGLASLVVLFYLLHSTPNVAVRTYVFFIGHPVAAVTSGIEPDEYPREHNRMHTQSYSLKNPPTEKATGSELKNYQVRKQGILYFAKFYSGI
ncbi:hypothetical protein [Sporosarcina aquimarina]|uniref:Uncharacterized protein n=1 Tax=Sporosarcina aquimarina TaxID=114975 RepID=A0ABU4G1T9_9BACL|nr:hypothetical protein [Sporosarcina aquimarina]MDW0110937.1 hypothetical protein [Sporosarcina aquimarina]